MIFTENLTACHCISPCVHLRKKIACIVSECVNLSKKEEEVKCKRFKLVNVL